jgi:hypothetical protein
VNVILDVLADVLRLAVQLLLNLISAIPVIGPELAALIEGLIA